MAEPPNRKQEKDFTLEVDQAVNEADTLVQVSMSTQ